MYETQVTFSANTAKTPNRLDTFAGDTNNECFKLMLHLKFRFPHFRFTPKIGVDVIKTHCDAWKRDKNAKKFVQNNLDAFTWVCLHPDWMGKQESESINTYQLCVVHKQQQSKLLWFIEFSPWLKPLNDLG